MEFNFLLKGLAIGFSVAAPIGPVGILCIKRSLTSGQLYGFMIGMGAATVDMLYAIIAGFGITIVSGILLKYNSLIQSIGILFLFYLGFKIFLEKTKKVDFSESKTKGFFRDYLTTFFLTVTHPATILFFATIFAGLGLGNTGGNFLSASLLVLGVFLGSTLWWLILSSSVGLFKKRITANTLSWVNKFSGVILFFIAIFLSYQLLGNII